MSPSIRPGIGMIFLEVHIFLHLIGLLANCFFETLTRSNLVFEPELLEGNILTCVVCLDVFL